jgi:hypothetical protein
MLFPSSCCVIVCGCHWTSTNGINRLLILLKAHRMDLNFVWGHFLEKSWPFYDKNTSQNDLVNFHLITVNFFKAGMWQIFIWCDYRRKFKVGFFNSLSLLTASDVRYTNDTLWGTGWRESNAQPNSLKSSLIAAACINLQFCGKSYHISSDHTALSHHHLT